MVRPPIGGGHLFKICLIMHLASVRRRRTAAHRSEGCERFAPDAGTNAPVAVRGYRSAAQNFTVRREGYDMKISSMTVLAIIAAMSPITLLAQTQTFRAEGVKVVGAGAINPPNPRDTCNLAKQDATSKA